MARTLTVTIDTTKYRTPQQSDIEEAKRYVLDRNETAIALASAIDLVLDRMAEQIVTVCYRYGIDPKRFVISQEYNADMMSEIADIMDEVDADIMDLIEEYSTRMTDDRDRISALLLWMSTLGRGNRNLQDTLDGYLYKTLRDCEAAIAALSFAGKDMAFTINRIKAYKHQIWTMPEMQAAFRSADEFEAPLIQTQGVTEGARGISSSGATNVTQMARITLEMAWMRSLRMDYEESGAAGYYVARGSTYPCALCDSMVGFHPITDIEGFPPYHPHCCCFTFPIYANTQTTD